MQFADLLFHHLRVLAVHLIHLLLLWLTSAPFSHQKRNRLLIAVVLVGESVVLLELRLGKREVGKTSLGVLSVRRQRHIGR